jgi:hypothetical protein
MITLKEKCSKCGKTKYPTGGTKPTTVKRVYQNGKPKYQLRQGEQGLSIFDAQISDADIRAKFKPGSKTDTKSVDEIEKKGFSMVQTHGDCDHLQNDVLEDNHWEIRPAPGMTRKQLKVALKTL